VYDKLLLLQALRPELPDATFFTTDLDELLLPQDKLRYTRNLLVASGYGLTLTPDLQRDVLPFRSSYQTSIFLPTTMANKKADPNQGEGQPLARHAGSPWLLVETAASVSNRPHHCSRPADRFGRWSRRGL